MDSVRETGRSWRGSSSDEEFTTKAQKRTQKAQTGQFVLFVSSLCFLSLKPESHTYKWASYSELGEVGSVFYSKPQKPVASLDGDILVKEVFRRSIGIEYFAQSAQMYC
jgi:hypothetical protein